MNTILLTGANGLLGFELLKQLSAQKKYKVFAISQSHIHDIETIDTENITVINASLSENNFIKLLPSNVDIIIHTAQSNNFRLFPDKAKDIFDVNVNATMLLLNYAKHANTKKFIYTSTGGVYTSGKAPFVETETMDFNPKNGFYPSSKYISELLIANYQTYFDCIVFRPFFIYGKRQKKDMLIPRLVENINQGNEIKLEGEHGLRINPIHVQDASDAILQSFDLNGSYTINLGGDEVLSLKQICEIIAKKMDKKTNFTHLEKIPNDVYGDIALLKKLIGAPRHRFEQSIDELLN